MGICSPHNVSNPTPQIGRCLKLAGNSGWLYQGWDARAGGGHPPSASFPVPYWGEAQLVSLASVYLQRNHGLLCWLLKQWFFSAWGQTAARLPWGLCWPVNLGLLPPRKLFRPNPEHYSPVLLTSVQPSTSWLGSSAQICPFLPNPTTGLLILHLLPASGWSTSTL